MGAFGCGTITITITIITLPATMGAFGCGTMLVWGTPALQHLDPNYCGNDADQEPCDVSMSEQEAIWVNAIAYLGCIFSVPFAGA